MSTLSRYSKKTVASVGKHEDSIVENFMGGNSYRLSPITTLRIIAASAIFGEPMYYRDGIKNSKTISNYSTALEYSIFKPLLNDNRTAIDIFSASIDAALEFDFKATLDLAFELRTKYFMRLNPAVIFVRAAEHKDRVKFNESNPGYMRKIGKELAIRPDDLTNQFDYYMFLNKSKNGLQSILKRTWADSLKEFSRYQLNKYKGKSLIDLVRISHANNSDIDELMRTGTLVMPAEDKTWEQLRSEKMSWKNILSTINMPHMALLRNLRGIFEEINGRDEATEILAKLKNGVLYGKQFPFRYYSAYKAIQGTSMINHRQLILDTLEECIDISISNMPKLEGRVACLSDNSGSAWGTMNSEYGSVTVAEIANLSSLITASQADEGEVGVFGDKLSLQTVSKRNGLLSQLKETSERGKMQGGGTENGVWLFWDKAILEKIHYDTVFIYSDMQAGHGGLFGKNPSEYKKYVHRGRGGNYIDVLSLVETYRKTVNPKVNVFTVQVAGYDNSVLPENLYRGAILAGWTGKEPMYAKSIIDAWDQAEGIKQ